MGFHDLPSFNDAMLGKQAYRLLENPTSLCAQVLKGGYFPNTDFLLVGCPKSASRTWTAIICCGVVLQQGFIKRISNGQDTTIWNMTNGSLILQL